MAQGARNRHDNADQHADDRENDGALRVVGQGVEDFGTGEDVETDQEDVVGEQHESGELVGDARLAKCVVSKVADVSDLGVFHDEFVHGHGGDPEEDPGADHGDDTGHPS